MGFFVAIEYASTFDPAKRERIRELLNGAETEQHLLTERVFLRRLQGGCSIPVFGLCEVELLDGFGSQLLMTGGIISLDGKEIIKGTDPVADST